MVVSTKTGGKESALGSNAAGTGSAPIAYLRAHGQSLRTLDERIAVLSKVTTMLTEGADELSVAQEKDRVVPSKFNPGMLCGACRYYIEHLPAWMEPEKLEETCPPLFKGGVEADLEMVSEPKGVCINVVPWNAPVTLAVAPMLAMLAAGNHVVVKPPELTPTVSAAFRSLCAKYLAGYVLVEEGGKEAVERLIDEGADHLAFTGGSEIAKVVAARCAQTLTPVTLELGGKSPVFIDKGLSVDILASSVREILETKVYKTGQFCCAHDYALVHEGIYDAFCATLQDAIIALGSKRNVKLLGAKQYNAVKGMLEGSEASLLPPFEGECAPDEEAMTLPMTAVLEPRRDSALLTKEVFGPLLPVLKVGSVEEATEIVKAMPTGKPLIGYCYSEDEKSVATFQNIAAGNIAVNAGPMRFHMNFNVGFGGVGSSGTGVALWGKEAFREFSNRKYICRAKNGFAKSYFSGPPTS
mmetsp:Transcript_55158/g.129136  ORF Transcript_55158/g.129136 Transcript_55158/m.129136 type:complete len:469 (-) Transcript_55158:63-1469(-)